MAKLVRTPIPPPGARATAWSGVVLIVLGLALILSRDPVSPPPGAADPACHVAYADLFRDPVFRVLVVFGYKDARPARFVGDRYERMLFVQRILAGCRPGEFACGFARSREDAELFMRVVDGDDGFPRRVELRVLNASVGPDDEDNRRNPYQARRSEAVRQAFREGLREAQVVFYNGHSRAGGGPDFSPPRLGRGQAVDLASYRRHPASLASLLADLREAPDGLQVLGMYSCASSRHFEAGLRRAKPGLGVIASSQLLYFSDALESSLASLSSLLGRKCEGDFSVALKSPEIRASGARISGFFGSGRETRRKAE